MNYYTVGKLNHDLIHLFLPKMPTGIDLVIGIPRDGILVATLISLYRNIPFTDLDSFCDGRVYQPGFKHRKEAEYYTDIKNVLLVDDICGTGRTMKDAKERIVALDYAIKIYTAALYVFGKGDALDIARHSGLVDFWGTEVIRPNHYEWTQSDAIRLPITFFDFDGVLCPDCPPEKDDDGKGYLDFLTNTPLKLKPQNIGIIITWRHQKYRKQTEEWLAKQGITYKQLIMAKREKWKNAIEFKAFHYKNSKLDLFIESSSKQAKEIARLTGKPVIGLETNEIFQ